MASFGGTVDVDVNMAPAAKSISKVLDAARDALTQVASAIDGFEQRLEAASQPPHKSKMYRERKLVEIERITFAAEQLERLGLTILKDDYGCKYAVIRGRGVPIEKLRCGHYVIRDKFGDFVRYRGDDLDRDWEEVPDDGDDTREANYGDRL